LRFECEGENTLLEESKRPGCNAVEERDMSERLSMSWTHLILH